MVAPVTGPFAKTFIGKAINPETGQFYDVSQKTQRWFKQRKPYNLPLEYDMTSTSVKPLTGFPMNTYVSVFRVSPPAWKTQALYNAAYSDFISGARGIQSVKSTLGATLGEWRSSSSMIATRANQLYAGFKAAKRGDLSGVKRAWGKHAGIRSRARASGSLVLEYSFGWAPLVEDLNAALAVLHNRIPALRARGRRQVSGEVSRTDDLGAVSIRSATSYTNGVSLRALVRVTNPNTLLAQQLGLVNLGSVLWELTPNSYIVDYFFNVGQFLDSFTDLVGVELEGASHTFFSHWTTTNRKYLSPGYEYQYGPPFNWRPQADTGVRVSTSRRIGIPRPRLSLNLPWTMSVQRASTSVARLLQLLKGK